MPHARHHQVADFRKQGAVGLVAANQPVQCIEHRHPDVVRFEGSFDRLGAALGPAQHRNEKSDRQRHCHEGQCQHGGPTAGADRIRSQDRRRHQREGEDTKRQRQLAPQAVTSY
ncbi:MAG: hypothetical protein ACK58P_14905 [Betaproteobacteria bacterium]